MKIHAKQTEQKLRTILTAVQELVPDGDAFYFRGAKRPKAEFMKRVAEALERYLRVRQAFALLARLVAERNEHDADARLLARDVKVAAGASYGLESKEYVRFGFKSPTPPAKLTPDQSAARAEKARATLARKRAQGA